MYESFLLEIRLALEEMISIPSLLGIYLGTLWISFFRYLTFNLYPPLEATCHFLALKGAVCL
jgi:hypothetical protein